MGGYFSSEPSPDSNESGEVQRSGSSSMDEKHQQRLDQAKKLRKPVLSILNEILRIKGKLNGDLVKENNAILKQFLDTFIDEMKLRDPLFAILYSRIYYTGSYYSDLRVSAPDEYDLNLVLKFPFKQSTLTNQINENYDELFNDFILNINSYPNGNELKNQTRNQAHVTYHPQVLSYAKYFTTDKDGISEKGLNKLFKDGYLIPNEVRIWLQSVVDKALVTYKYPKYPQKVKNIKTSGAGPARTIILVKDNGVIDIDLVPAIECSMNLKPPGIHGKVYEKFENNLKCFLVPKPYQPNKQAPVNEIERVRLWRTHYPEAERIILQDLKCAKSVIKLLKLLRDKENWKILASYYLKTIVMWMVLENSTFDYWKDDQLGERFMEALNILAENVRDRRIRYFFSSRYNLLEKLTDIQADNIRNRLRAIIRDIERNPENLWDIFGCHKAFSMI